MKVSLNWIRQINQQYRSAAEPAPNGVDELVEKIGKQLGAVEEVIDLGKKYKGITVAKVISCEKHPNADKLSVCMIDVGKAKSVQVVCGAPDVKAGQSVAWIPPGAMVPSSYDKDPFVVEAREIRGVMSHGMIASAKELDINEDHEGILVIEEDSIPAPEEFERKGEVPHTEFFKHYRTIPLYKPGDDFAKAFGLDDYIIDIENKMFTHRPDCFGMLGIAREIAGIQGHMFVSPPEYKVPKTTGKYANERLKLGIRNEVPDLVPRFVALAFYNIEVAPSEVWMQSYLSRVGVRPINNIVDITNYFMLETGQPLHAYDYDKVKTGKLGIRLSRKGESLKLLGGKEIKLDDGAVVITDGQKPIGLGGIMGGADTEVDANTKNIILECANFDMNLTRLTAMTYGLFTDAATRFTKNQSPWQNDRVVAWASGEITHQAGGEPDGVIHDIRGKLKENQAIKLSAQFVNSRLGTDLSAYAIKKILENVEFEVRQSGKSLTVTAPFWRTDIEIPEDIVEEVGRLYGYDKLPIELPMRDLAPAKNDQELQFKARLRKLLSATGANEVLTHSFVNDSLLIASGQDPKLAFHIRNAHSPELHSYRVSLTPSLLDKVHSNIKNGYSQFAIFEMNRVHIKPYKEKSEPELPKEFRMLALVFASKDRSTKNSGSPLYEARSYLDSIASQLGLEFSYSAFDKAPTSQVMQPFDYKRSALVTDKVSDTQIGIVGEYKASVREHLKLPRFIAGFEIDTEQLLPIAKPHRPYKPLNRYPSVEQDFCLRSGANLSYEQLTDFINKELEAATKAEDLIFEISPLDIFQRPNEPNHKQTTWHIELTHPQRTLTTAESNRILDGVAKAAKAKLKAERI